MMFGSEPVWGLRVCLDLECNIDVVADRLPVEEGIPLPDVVLSILESFLVVPVVVDS